MFFKTPGVNKQVLISSCLYIGHATVGFGSAWTGPIIPKLQNPEQSPIPYEITEAQISFIATISYLGAIAGPFACCLSNSFGRKPCLIAGGVLGAIGYIIMALASNVPMVYGGRWLTGFAGGIINVMNIVYLGEIASTNIRGILLTTLEVFLTGGSIILFAVGQFFSYSATTFVGTAMSAVFALTLLMLPESPTFYVLKGKEDELVKVLQQLGRSEDIDELKKEDTVRKESVVNSTKRDWLDLFTIKSNRKALLIVVVINILQNASGILAVVFFSATIFKMAESTLDSNICMIIIACFQLVGSTITPVFVERAGRKIILEISSAICCLSMFALGLYFYLYEMENHAENHVKWLPLVLLVLYFVGYEFGFGIIPNIIVGEMFTKNVRSKGSTLTMTVSWLCGFLVNTAFGMVLEIVGGHVTFWFFSLICASAFIFTIFFIPETKGKSLLEIQDMLGK